MSKMNRNAKYDEVSDEHSSDGLSQEDDSQDASCRTHPLPTPPPQPRYFHFQGRHSHASVRSVCYTRQRHPCPYRRNLHTSHARIQCGHLGVDGRPARGFGTAIACGLQTLYGLEYVHVRCTTDTKSEGYVNVVIVSSTPLPLPPGRNWTLPLMLDGAGFHVPWGGDGQALYDYAYFVGTPNARRDLLKNGLVSEVAQNQHPKELSMKLRHRQCGATDDRLGQPSGLLRVQIMVSTPMCTPSSDDSRSY